MAFTDFIFFLSKYCLIIWEQWWRIVHLGTLPSMEVNFISSTCMCLRVLFRIDAIFFVVWNVGVTFTCTTGWQLQLGYWTTWHGYCGSTFASSCHNDWNIYKIFILIMHQYFHLPHNQLPLMVHYHPQPLHHVSMFFPEMLRRKYLMQSVMFYPLNSI